MANTDVSWISLKIAVAGCGSREKICSKSCGINMAESEGLTSTAFILPTTMANFCFNYQRYQSLATERTWILPKLLEKQIGHLLVAVVVTLDIDAPLRR